MTCSTRKLAIASTFILVTGSLLAANASAGEVTRSDPVLLRFSTVGDSRQDPVGFDPSVGPLSAEDRIWLQNGKALSRIMREVETQKTKLLFFNGDMIMGYGQAGPAASASVEDVVGSDLMTFYRQYAYWRGMVATLIQSGTYVVPVPGNHEVQSKAAGKKAVVENEIAWRANMGDLILDSNRFRMIVGKEPTAINVQNNSELDLLSSDQSQLSFSFDVEGSHFAVINTDPVGNDNIAPSAWLESDLSAAKQRGAKNYFVFGHKPAFTYVYKQHQKKVDGVGLDKFPAKRDSFWDVIEKFGATYFCGHEHMFNMMQPRSAAWQVLVGTGGSPWDAKPGEQTLHPLSDRAYAWATVDIHESGRVKITAYGFDEHFGPTKVLQQVNLHEKKQR